MSYTPYPLPGTPEGLVPSYVNLMFRTRNRLARVRKRTPAQEELYDHACFVVEAWPRLTPEERVAFFVGWVRRGHEDLARIPHRTARQEKVLRFLALVLKLLGDEGPAPLPPPVCPFCREQPIDAAGGRACCQGCAARLAQEWAERGG
jgi:hypothetical protein